MTRLARWGPPLAFMALIFYSSSRSDPAPELTSIVWDKALHLAGYAVLAVLYAQALRGERLRPGTVLAGAIVLTSLYGLSDEWHQAFVPPRQADPIDWVADTVGGTIGAAVFSTALHLRHRLRR